MDPEPSHVILREEGVAVQNAMAESFLLDVDILSGSDTVVLTTEKVASGHPPHVASRDVPQGIRDYPYTKPLPSEP